MIFLYSISEFKLGVSICNVDSNSFPQDETCFEDSATQKLFFLLRERNLVHSTLVSKSAFIAIKILIINFLGAFAKTVDNMRTLN